MGPSVRYPDQLGRRARPISVTRQLVTVLGVAVFSAAQAGTIFVDVDNCPGPGTGSVGDPYCSIQTAIVNAVDTDEIVVAPGTYFEIVDFLGKAIWLHSSNGPEATIIDALFTGSVVTCDSGEGPDSVLQAFTIKRGYNDYGGGMRNDGTSPIVIDCIFFANIVEAIVDGLGGGMFNFGGSPTVINCTFDSNFAGGINGGVGGGMYNEDSSPTIIGCRFTRNNVPLTVAAGGGMYNNNSYPIIINCLFDANVSTFAGGMLNTASSPTMINCTFAGNDFGAMISGNNSSPTITNCIFWANEGFQIFDGILAVTTVSYSDVQGGWFGAGSNNIDVDPLFVDPDNGDYRLSAGSPCIDAGDNTAVPETVTTDLDGNPRFVDDPDTVDSGDGAPPVVDMGAYEFQPTACPWDCGGDNDGNVGINDFLALLAQWGGPGSCDFDRGAVGISDFLELLANWGPCP